MLSSRHVTRLGVGVSVLVILLLGGTHGAALPRNGPLLMPLAIEAPDDAQSLTVSADGVAACATPAPVRTYAFIHCYTPADIAAAYGVAALHAAGNMGAGQTIVLVDAYGSPTAASDLQFFHDTFFASLPDPNFDAVFPLGAPDYQNTSHGNGQSGPSAAAGWAAEATLDIEWAYAIAPKAHLVLLAVPPAETEGVQGFPNLFKAMRWAIDNYPPGTIFSQSFGVTEQTFGGAARVQTAKFDAVYKAAAVKGDTMLASSGDSGSLNLSKQHRDSGTYSLPTDNWPAASPYVTAVGGTQLQYGWTWAPTSDVPFDADGNFNAAYWSSTASGDTEVVWNESWLPAATGGGPSTIYARPPWQSGQASIIGTDARGVPDVSWNAAVNGGVLVYTSFFPNVNRVGWHIFGGTSASAPQVAGVIALANEQQALSGQPPLGFLDPLLYAVGTGAAFRDIVPVTQGTAASGVLRDNRQWQFVPDGSAVVPESVTGWPVLTGWDMTTGFGSPRASPFVAALRAARNSP
jgi:subtilase family serine protease